MRRVALLLAMAWPMAAQVPLYLDLAGEWRIGPADDPLYARAEVDDGDWQRYSLPRTRPFPMSETRWLRYRVEIPAGADTSSLVLTMGPVSEVYELYVNGVRVGSRGGWKLSRVTPARPEQFIIPPSLLTAGTSAVIAMRVWRPFFLGPAYRTQNGRAADTGPYLLTSRENAPRDVAAAIERKRERLALESLITGEFYLIVAMLLVLAWVTERQRREVFLMVAYLGAEAVFRLSNYLSFLMDWSFQAQVINGFLISLASTIMALLAMKLAGWEPRWLRAVAWLQLLWHVGTNAIVWSSDIDYKGFRTGWLLGPLGAVLLLGLIYGTIQAVRRAVRQREGWPWLLLLSMMVVLLRFHAYQSMYFFQALPRAILRIEALEIEFQGYDVASVVLTLAIAALLLQRMGADRREKARLSAEMEAARLVQESLLGAAAAATPGFTVNAAYLPASEVGGDFHIEVQHDDGSLLVLVGDVSGKGLRAALLVGHVSGVVHGQRSRRPAEVLANLNDSLVGRVGGGFVTCCCARFELNGHVSIANAGHLPPYSAGNEVAVEGGLPLGVVPGVEYAEMETAIDGSMLFLSDGVVEAANAQGELFGFERTRVLSGQSAARIAEAARAWGQNDDITVVTVRRAAAL